MKKVILFILAMAIFLSVNTVNAATAMTEIISDLKVRTNEYLYVYSGTNAGAGVTTYWEVPLKYNNGRISFCRVTVGDSDDADLWFSGEDTVGVDGPYTFLHAEDVDGSFTFPIETPKPYFNMETVKEKRLILGFQNDSASDSNTFYVLISVEGK